MCRAKAVGGRRCPCCRGDRRRAYQRLRYALQKAEDDATNPPIAPIPDDALDDLTEDELEQRRLDTAATLDAALTAYRATPHHDATPDVLDAYATAVIEHGAALRDLALHRAEQDLQQHNVDDHAIAARATDIAATAKRIDDAIAAHRAAAAAANDPDHASTTINELARAKAQLIRDTFNESKKIERQRTEIIRAAYYRELARERSFGTAAFTPTNNGKMTRADRAMFTTATALYPDDMVNHTAALGPILAKRSKTARAHYSSAKPQRKRRTQIQVLDLSEALQHGRLTSLQSYFVDSPEAMMAGAQTGGHLLARKYATVPRTPDNERRIAELVIDFNNDRQTTQAHMEFTTRQGPEGPEEVIYVRGPRTITRMVRSGVAAEITYSDSNSMTHELAHRMEDRNPEISVATKHFLQRRTQGQPKQRYYKTEWVIPDGFADRYIGKDYPNTHHTELFSCGMEALTQGRFGGLRGQVSIDLNSPNGKSAIESIIPRHADPEHLALVLGVLAAANKPIQR